MKITKENRQDIRERAIKLWQFCGLDSEDYDIHDEYVEEDEDCVNFDFPGDQECVMLGVDDLINITDKLDTYEEQGESTVRCANISQTSIVADEWMNYEHKIRQEVYITDDYTARIINEPILIGIRNLKHNCYDNDFWSPCYMYQAVEFRYNEGAKKLPYEKEMEELQRFLFMLQTKYQAIFRTEKLIEADDGSKPYDYDMDDLDTEQEDEMVYSQSSDLPSYTPMLKMYMDAVAISDQELRFLLFYKIIEYIAPRIARQQAHKMLASRLDMHIFEKHDVNYYDSIIDLVHRFDKSISDSELASTVLAECCDFESFFEIIPPSAIKIISTLSSISLKKGLKDITYEDVSKLKKSLGSCLYATRNSIVHAKSNYMVTGRECPLKELAQLNDFMKRFTYTIIMWNERQAETMKF